jgi:hypothetical protein
MPRCTALKVLPFILAAHAAAQPTLYGVRGNGDLVRINAATGAATLVGGSSVATSTATGYNASGGFETIWAGGPTSSAISVVNRWTGAISWSYSVPGAPPGYSLRAIAVFPPTPGLNNSYVLLGSQDPTAPELLARIESGSYTVIGSTGRTDLTSMVYGPRGLTALGTDTIDPFTGAAALVGGGFDGDALSLTFTSSGLLLSCGANLRAVDYLTGQATLIGPTGFTDMRGLAEVSRHGCYADCFDDVATPPRLNINDFVCFMYQFAYGDAYANCDQSTTPPVLNVNDFICFLTAFASADGC